MRPSLANIMGEGFSQPRGSVQMGCSSHILTHPHQSEEAATRSSVSQDFLSHSVSF